MITVPEQKRIKALNWLQKIRDSRKATVKQLQQLTGLLNFVAKAIVPGRTFTRRMYTKYSNLEQLNPKLRQYHHINLDKEFKEDCEIWLEFLTMNDQTSISRPFEDLRKGTNDDSSEKIQFHSDATGNISLGIGILYNSHWTYQCWEEGFIRKYNPSIEFLELYAVAVGIFMWSKDLANRRVILYCDNKSAVGMLNSTVSKCKYCMTLIRKIILRSLNYNFRIFGEHVKGTDNYLADNLSRLNISKFKELAAKDHREIDENPTEISDDLWPLSTYWETYCKNLK